MAKTPNGYYDDFRNLQSELEKLIAENDGRFPSWRDLEEDRNDIIFGVRKHGGMRAVKKQMGFTSNVKPDGYWNNPDNILAEAQAFLREHDEFTTLPNKETLSELGCSSLGAATRKFPGGARGLREKLGETVTKKPVGYWDDPVNIEADVRDVMNEHNLDSAPSKKQLDQLGESGLSRAISLHGGFRKLRKHLDETKILGEPGKWKDNDYALARAREIMEKHGFDTFPSQGVLVGLGYHDIARGIQKFQGGFHQFRELLGEEQERRKHGTWTDLETCIQTVVSIIEQDELDYVPNSKYLGEKGYHGLVSAISQYHGGMPRFRELVEGRIGLESEGKRLESLLESYVGKER